MGEGCYRLLYCPPPKKVLLNCRVRSFFITSAISTASGVSSAGISAFRVTFACQYKFHVVFASCAGVTCVHQMQCLIRYKPDIHPADASDRAIFFLLCPLSLHRVM